MIKKAIVLLIAGLFLVPSLGLAKPGPDMMKHARMGVRLAEKNLCQPRMLLRFQDEIGLTKSQVAKIEKMHEKFQEVQIRQRADRKILELKFKSLLKNDKVDRKKMAKMVRDIAEMRTNAKIDKLNFLLDIKEILTPEQLKKIDALKKKMRRHRGMRGDKMRGKRGMPGQRMQRPMPGGGFQDGPAMKQ